MISGLIIGGEIARKLWWKLWWLLRFPWLKLQVYARDCWQSSEVRKIAREFCAEVAVLVAVFPALDGLIANAGIRADPKLGNTAHPIPLFIVLLVSAFFVAFFLLAAVILASREKEVK